MATREAGGGTEGLERGERDDMDAVFMVFNLRGSSEAANESTHVSMVVRLRWGLLSLELVHQFGCCFGPSSSAASVRSPRVQLAACDDSWCQKITHRVRRRADRSYGAGVRVMANLGLLWAVVSVAMAADLVSIGTTGGWL